MDAKFIEEFEKALEDEIEGKKAALDLEKTKRLNAFKIACGTATPVRLVSGSISVGMRPPPPPPPKPFPGVKTATEEAIEAMKGEFTSNDLKPVINAKYPLNQVSTQDLSNPLWVLRKEGKIEITSVGKGRIASSYRKKSQ